MNLWLEILTLTLLLTIGLTVGQVLMIDSLESNRHPVRLTLDRIHHARRRLRGRRDVLPS
jgi:hypothetical protein